jgi:DNA-binding IclR family transcriptional regulator
MISPKTGGIDDIVLVILADVHNNTVEEISRKIGIKEEAVYHLLEFLTIIGVVKKQNNRYFAEEKVRVLAQLLLDLEELDITN